GDYISRFPRTGDCDIALVHFRGLDLLVIDGKRGLSLAPAGNAQIKVKRQGPFWPDGDLHLSLPGIFRLLNQFHMAISKGHAGFIAHVQNSPKTVAARGVDALAHTEKVADKVAW